MTKKNKIILLIIAIIIILLIPIKTTLDDGGTVVYNSLTYKIINWHEENITYVEGYKTGKDVYFFPNNFKSVQYYSDLASAERERNFGVANIIDSKECTSEEKELFYTKDEFEYYFDCNKSYNVTVIFNDKSTMSLPLALDKNLLVPEELGIYNINYEKINSSEENEEPEEIKEEQ